MPPKKTSNIVPVNPRILHLPCEWQECQFVTDEMEKFIKHLSEHLTELLSSVTPPEQVLGCFNCKWRNCDVAVIGHISDYTRHVFFHAFHTKIKCIGSMLVKNLELHACTLDSQSCNLIPDLPECLQCGWTHCGAVYDNPEFFYRHVDFHADSFPNGNNLKGGCDCQWEGCDVNVKSKHKLREHLRSHTQQKLVACPNCGGFFSSRTKFFDHLERQKDVQSYQCSYCNKKFQTERLMRDHVRIHVNCYKCPLCDMTCPNPHGLRNHLRYKHTSERQYNCLECDYRSKTPSDLRRHMETHSENTIMCHVKGCCFVTRVYQCLASHYQKTHQGIDTHRFACHICKAFFTRGSLLTKHLKKTHKYRLPSGYSRFRYNMSQDGFWRLQTVRYESVNLIEQVIVNAADPTTSGPSEDCGPPPAPTTEVVSTTYNLEMLGDVALHTPNKLDIVSDKVEEAEEEEKEDEVQKTEENLVDYEEDDIYIEKMIL
ncbi:histone H4 transcription factor-like isoform X1 [Argonauta hians]